MKILQVIQFFAPKFGGTVDVVYNLSKELSKRGHEVTIITTDLDYDKEYVIELENEGVEVIPFKCKFNLASFLYSPSMNNWLKLNLQKFDLIHLHNFRSYQNNIVHKYSKKYNVPYILQAHGSVLPFFQKQGLKKVYDHIWGYKLLEDASKVIGVSNVELKQYKELGVTKDKIVVVPNGINLDKFGKKPVLGHFKLQNDIKTEKIVLFLGRIHKIKGLKFLIESFKLVLKDVEDITLVVAGPDEGYKKELEGLTRSLGINEKVKFINYVENVNEAYHDADLLVYPAVYEIFGLVPFEAILCGTPVIVTDDCGCGDLIKKLGVGYLVEYGNVIDLKEKIDFVIKNPDDALKKVEIGKKFIRENLRWESVVKRVEKVYEDCIYNI